MQTVILAQQIAPTNLALVLGAVTPTIAVVVILVVVSGWVKERARARQARKVVAISSRRRAS